MPVQGIIDKLSPTIISGWAKSDFSSAPLFIRVKNKRNDQIIKQIEAVIERPDLNKLDVNAKGFRIDLSTLNFRLDELYFECECEGETAEIVFWRPLALSIGMNQLPQSELKILLDHLAYEPYIELRNLLVSGTSQSLIKSKKSKLAVVSYANGEGGWFEYFYKYYSKVVDPISIYIITPKPQQFQKYVLGGVISCPDMEFDDVARAYFMSSFASGLLAYFEWTLVCDIDEIIIPNPLSGKSFTEALDSTDSDVLVTRGLDVIQLSEEPDFNFEEPVLSQRRCAILNTAISKPHLSKVPISYSAGFHYSNYKCQIPSPEDGFITLHLKWACKKIREEVQSIVANTRYADKNIELYCKKTVSESALHPSYTKAIGAKRLGIHSVELKEFEDSYYRKLNFSNLRGLWLGEHMASQNFFDLSTLEVALKKFKNASKKSGGS